MNAIRLSFSLWLLAGGSSALAAAQVHDCDRLAAFGPDPQAVAPGVDLGAIDAGAAIWACRAAIEADSEEPRFRYQLGRALLAKSEETQAFEAIKAVAERFYPAALNSLGYLYLHGMGTAPDPAAALVWYRRGADAGNSVSLNMVGRFYENGWGVDPDDAEALRWFQRAAEAGNAPAMNNVGLFHQFGRGTAQDSILARRWFRNAAEAGAPAGMNNLGVMYYSGYGGLEVDQAEAFGWYVKAAERGYHFAKNNLGEMYEDGETVEADPAKARQLYRHAADQGLGLAMLNLARLDDQGIAGDQAREAAAGWLMMALETDPANRRNVIDSLTEIIGNFSTEALRGLQSRLKQAGRYSDVEDGVVSDRLLAAIGSFRDG